MAAPPPPVKKHSEADKLLCSFCQEPADLNLSLEHRQCGGRTHTECLPAGQKPNYKLCAQCTGEYVPLAAVASMDASAPAGGREPFPPDGVDYVLHPGVWVQEAPSALRSIAGLFSRTQASGAQEQQQQQQDPHFLIRNRVSVRDMLRYNKLGLQHLLKAGVTMSELLANDYTWNDLLLYEDVGRKGPTRCKQALAQGLKTNANHFRDYPDALPFAKVSAHAQLRPYDLCGEFGLRFPVTVDERTGHTSYGSLQCHGDEKWNARDCVRLGLRMDDLSAFGLSLVQQYEDLLVGLTHADAVEAERNLQVTPEHITGLIDINAPVAPQPLAPAPAPIVAVAAAQPALAPAQAPLVVGREKVSAPAIQQQQQQIYVVQAAPEPVYEIPVAAPRVLARPRVAASPAFHVPMVNRFDRHGAILAPARRGK